MSSSAYVSSWYLPKQFERETYIPRAMETETAAAPVVEKTPLELALEGKIVIVKKRPFFIVIFV